MTTRTRALALAGVLAAGAGAMDASAQAPAVPPAELQAKIRKLQDAMAKREQTGIPPVRIAWTMQGFEPLMREGKLREAERLLDRALELAEKGAKDPLEQKLTEVFERVKRLEKTVRRMELVGMVMARMEGAVKGGGEKEAESAVDIALAILKNEDPADVPEVRPYIELQAKMKTLHEREERIKASGGDEKPFSAVDGMAGVIEVESKPGHGSTFRITLPAAGGAA